MLKMSRELLAFFMFLLLTPLAFSANIYGYVEKVLVNPGQFIAKAKLDTGAVSASLSAVNIKEFKKDKQPWIRFEIPDEPKNIMVERPLKGYVKIKTRRGERKKGFLGRWFRRPVVSMFITIGNKTKEIEVNLANRKRFNYPILLGREALIAFGIIVDPSQAFVSKLKR